ncbi:MULTISPECIES: flagellar basal-body rod protein FlgF [Comamonas]|uniref:Flagellar basal-body rod protein FlgF n=1 Tax=Comamonas avium TaxID=2762231 RepID=A0ABR8S8M5_9BURK|nr:MULTISPECIES: flagellar basal-body rod protein FlgF [Comamonas]MBD7959828.1 flagellar basal-body rod protein FlgF [Comamonas avium]MBD9403483.1 flagellar basal-body rod protein FlgF [Comamonas sp. CMM02]
MDRIIYTTMTGANAAAQRQAVLSNNLANVSTTGFRAELSTFRSVPLEGQGSSTRVFGLDATSGHLDQPGPAMTTGKSTDLMARGNAWFAVQGLDGLEAYTRNGALEVNAEGQLVTANGLAVLTDGGAPVDIPQNARISFGGDGTVVATLDGQDPINIGRLKMVTPNLEQTIQRGDDGLFRSAQGDLPADVNATMVAGALEGSNVNAVEAMVGMIAASRQFEQQMKLLTTAETNDKTASQLLSMNG